MIYACVSCRTHNLLVLEKLGGFDGLYYNKILVEVESNFRGDKIIL